MNLVAQVTVLSSLHIGTGTELLKDVDWFTATDDWKYTYVPNEDTLLDTVLRRAEADGQPMHEVSDLITGRDLSELVEMGWIGDDDLRSVGGASMFRYRMRGEPASDRVREQLKDVFGRPYLPGSTLKGALRTIVAHRAFSEIRPSLNALGHKPQWAGQPIERALFGADPHHDLMRAFQVGDSDPVDSDSLQLINVQVFPTARSTGVGDGGGIVIDAESVKVGTEFIVPIRISDHLLEDRGMPFDKRRRQELGDWPAKRDWLVDIASSGRAWAREVLLQEARYFGGRRGVDHVINSIRNLGSQLTNCAEGEFLLALGWGTGWHTKTLSHQLQQDPEWFAKQVSRFRMDKKGTFEQGVEFPRSRHLVLREPRGEPRTPLGWVKIQLVDA